MKSTFFKIAVLGILLCSFSLQSFTPPLPLYTTIRVDDLSFLDSNGNPQLYYAVKVITTGYLLEDNTTSHQSTSIVSTPRDDYEWFITDFQAYYSGWYGPITNASVYVKQYSTSSWVYKGSKSTISGATLYYVDNYLNMMAFSIEDLPIEEPIE
jgi:hypothetical protein